MPVNMCVCDGVEDSAMPETMNLAERVMWPPPGSFPAHHLGEPSDDEPMIYPDSDDCMGFPQDGFEAE